MRALRSQGFTLVELMVAIVLAGFGLAAASQVAQIAIRKGGQGKQGADATARNRLVIMQFRDDLAIAGYGSSGAVAVSGGTSPWSGMFVNSVNARPTIPAISGANNIGAGPIAGFALLPGSDAIMLVVPDPASSVRTNQLSPLGTSGIFAPAAPASPGLAAACTMVYVSDHSAPNGAGRTQIAFFGSFGAGSITLAAGETLQFDVAQGSEVMCARVSTYFVADVRACAGQPSCAGHLLRRDLVAVTPPSMITGASGRVFINSGAAGGATILPGVMDFQLAYRFSSALQGMPRGAGATIATPWAFDAGADGTAEGSLAAIAAPAGPNNGWYEVRQVRFNLLTRSLRAIIPTAGTVQEPVLEDSPIAVGGFYAIGTAYHYDINTASADMIALRFYDQMLPFGVIAEPF